MQHSDQLGSLELFPSPDDQQRGSGLFDAIDKILDKGLVINGDISLAVGGAELLSLRVNLVISSIETAKRYGIELPWEKWNHAEESRNDGGFLNEMSRGLNSFNGPFENSTSPRSRRRGHSFAGSRHNEAQGENRKRARKSKRRPGLVRAKIE